MNMELGNLKKKIMLFQFYLLIDINFYHHCFVDDSDVLITFGQFCIGLSPLKNQTDLLRTNYIDNSLLAFISHLNFKAKDTLFSLS